MTQHMREAPRFLGGEMLNWSDLDGVHGPGPVRGAALAPFFAAARGRTLIAGPHDPALLDTVPDATVLVRGVADAETLARRGGVTVLCGSPAKLSAEAPFDTVIALAGLECLGTAEDDDLTWAETLDVLREALTPGGVLVLGLQNFTGIHRQIAVPQSPADADWTPLPDESRPAGLIQARAVLGQATRAYGVYPGLWSPEVILDEQARGGVVEAALTRAFAPQGVVVADPGTVAVECLRQGLGVLAAPAWVVVAARDEVRLPEIACGPPRGPEGPTLESVLLRAAGRRDLPGLRRLLAAWQSSAAQGVRAGQVILTGGDGFEALEPAATPAGALHNLAARLRRGGFAHPWPDVRSTAELASLLAAMAGREPGTPGAPAATEEGAPSTPAGTGMDAPSTPANAVTDPPGALADIESGERATGTDDEAVARADDGTGRVHGDAIGQVDGGAAGEADGGEARPVVLTELLAERDRLRTELAEARALAAFFEGEFDAGDAELRQLRRTVELLSGSGPARAGQVFVGGVRAARRVLRR